MCFAQNGGYKDDIIGCKKCKKGVYNAFWWK